MSMLNHQFMEMISTLSTERAVSDSTVLGLSDLEYEDGYQLERCPNSDPTSTMKHTFSRKPEQVH